MPRLSPRRFAAVLAVLGVVAAAAFLFVPVKAAFADDPLLRYGRFAGSERGVTDIECGSPVSSLLRRTDGLSFYGLARDDACRHAAFRRAATAVAAGGVMILLGLVGATAAAGRGRA